MNHKLLILIPVVLIFVSIAFSNNAFSVGNVDHFVVTNSTDQNVPDQHAGAAFNVKIVAKDINGSTVTGFTGQVNMSNSLGGMTPNLSGFFISGVDTGDFLTFIHTGVDHILVNATMPTPIFSIKNTLTSTGSNLGGDGVYDPTSQRLFYFDGVSGQDNVFNASSTIYEGSLACSGGQPFTGVLGNNKLWFSFSGAGRDVIPVNTNTLSCGSLIGVGVNPDHMVYNSLNKTLFVSSSRDSDVQVINTTSLSNIATISTGAFDGVHTFDLQFDSFTDKILATNEASNQVSIISGKNDTLITNVNVGTNPSKSAIDTVHHWLYTINMGSNNVSVISLLNNTKFKTISVGNEPEDLVYVNGKVYVDNLMSGSVSVITTSSNTVTSTITGVTGAYRTLYDTANGFIFVADGTNGGLFAIDPVTDSIVGHITTISAFPNRFTFNPVNGDVYFNEAGGKHVYVIQTSFVAGGISNAFNVLYGTPDHFLIVNSTNQAIPNVIRTAPFTIHVIAQDAFNNTITNYGNNVTLTDSLGGMSPINILGSSFVSGVANVSIPGLTQVGTDQFTATDTLILSTSNFFDVVGQTLDHFFITNSTNQNIPHQYTNMSFIIKIEAIDPAGHVDLLFNNTIGLSNLLGGITPNTTLNFTAGVIPLQTVRIDRVGLDHIIPGYGNVTTLISNDFNLTLKVPDKPGLKAIAISPTGIRLQSTPGASFGSYDVIYYGLKCSVNGGSYLTIVSNSTLPITRFYEKTGLQPTDSLVCQWRDGSKAGWSDWSDPASGTTSLGLVMPPMGNNHLTAFIKWIADHGGVYFGFTVGPFIPMLIGLMATPKTVGIFAIITLCAMGIVHASGLFVYPGWYWGLMILFGIVLVLSRANEK